MRNRVERLRIWLLGGAGLLVLVVAGFLGLARERAGGRSAHLPRGFGVDTETANPTYSHSVGGKTIYTIRAARQIKHSDGKFTLRDVAVEMYGQKQDRMDRIYGDEFEYDEKEGVVRAVGVVHIDLQSASPADKAGRGRAEPKEAKVLHATTSGLVYIEKLGVAATDQEIQFQLGELTGRATGADYESDSGLLALHSAVRVNGIAGKRPIVLTAATAELDDKSQQTVLTQAKYVSLGETVEAEHAVMHTRPDGSAERLEAQGNVSLSSDQGTLRAESADVMLNAASQPQTAKLTGSLHYVSDAPTQQAKGQADSGTIDFDALGKPKHAVFTGAVRMTERARLADVKVAQDVKEVWSMRDLTAAKVDAVLISDNARKTTRIQDAEATGSAHLTVTDDSGGSVSGSAKAGTIRKDLSADDLKAHLIPNMNDGAARIDSVVGRGHTVLRQVDAKGIEQTSTGDSLEVKFGALASTTKPGQFTEEIESAVQTTHVTMTRIVPAAAAGKVADEEDATGERAVYDGRTQRMTLTRAVRVMKPGSMLWADEVVVDRETGDADANGAVRVSYVKVDDGKVAAKQASVAAQPEEPVHILAERAHMDHAADVTTFYGKAGRPARLWKAGSQVEAPVIEFDRAQKKMKAHGDGQTAGAVHTVMVTAGGATVGPGKNGTLNAGLGKIEPLKSGQSSAPSITVKAGKTETSRAPQVIRIASRGLTYSEALRQADFTGGVRAESAESAMVSQKATVYLHAANPPAIAVTDAVDPLASFSGSIDRIVATGQIVIDQPERRATGGQAVYTASDGLFVLTGEGSVLPRVVTSDGSSTTGTSLRFHSGDDSVEVSGSPAGANGVAQRVHTEIKAKQQ